MEINREKFRVAALLIALANTGCGPAQRQINFQEEETGWTGSAPPPIHQPGPNAEYYPPPYEAGIYVPPPYEAGYGPPAEEWYPPPAEYYPSPTPPIFE
jgi:hypothetical protein